MTVISYPIPAYQNYPIQPQFYIPSRFVISGVLLGLTTFVSTIEDMNYVIGQQVRLLIPQIFGCYQLNEVSGYIISLPLSNQVEISIDSSKNVDPYISATSTIQSPQIIAIGDINLGIINANGRKMTGTFIPGSFQDISPL